MNCISYPQLFPSEESCGGKSEARSTDEEQKYSLFASAGCIDIRE